MTLAQGPEVLRVGSVILFLICLVIFGYVVGFSVAKALYKKEGEVTKEQVTKKKTLPAKLSDLESEGL